MKFSDHFSNLLGINFTKFYSDLFRFDISFIQCLGVYFFPHTVYTVNSNFKYLTSPISLTSDNFWYIELAIYSERYIIRK